MNNKKSTTFCLFSHLKSTIESLEADEAIKSGFPCKVADKDLGMIGLKIYIFKILKITVNL